MFSHSSRYLYNLDGKNITLISIYLSVCVCACACACVRACV